MVIFSADINIQYGPFYDIFIFGIRVLELYGDNNKYMICDIYDMWHAHNSRIDQHNMILR